MSPTLTIAKREFRSYFDSPVAYVVICLSLFVLGIWTFVGPGHYWQVDRATLAPVFETLPGGLVLLTCVVTMRTMAEEKRAGTLEMLITLPVKDSEVILGKYIGALGLVLTFVTATLLYPILMFKWPWSLGVLDMGPVVSGYIGLVLFSAASVAIGLLISSLTESQVIAFIVLAAFYWIGELGSLVHNLAGIVLRELSFKEHYASFGRGLIDTTDIVFFLSCAGLALILSFRALESRKWA
jgi:ABC-2 type transport system permease protein